MIYLLTIITNSKKNNMSYYDKAKDIYDMMAQGKMLDAYGTGENA